MVLILIPLAFGWRVAFSKSRGKAGTVLYFACLGLGYIIVEVGLISRFVVALGNPTISAAVLIGGMLVFSGLGSLVSERILTRARTILPFILAIVAAVLIGYGTVSSLALDWIGTLPYGLRLGLCVGADRAARVPDGLPDADGDGLARPARQVGHVRLGVGHQRLLLGRRRGGGADHRHDVRRRRARHRRRGVPRRGARVLRGAVAGARGAAAGAGVGGATSSSAR